MPEQIRVTHLRTEYAQNPLGIDVVHPRLSWWLESERSGARQTAYQIVVGRSSALAQQPAADLLHREAVRIVHRLALWGAGEGGPLPSERL